MLLILLSDTTFVATETKFNMHSKAVCVNVGAMEQQETIKQISP